ncbi:hypothetical protein [Acidithiobacillus ferridurans]|uniref:Uncharacterized protein n=1 Tax=Acidithiobacillus ferridurans TaxID=1232575 RepID=A0A8X8G5R4_ACIFI|nr:hypothetical protein [Acidithiobacillus ferridurans]MBU2716953.1 hypothetical protein [Acidithiobacillus ferridurans]MBU2721800.1 hypothetical protein [Acidithiobacillus ferridurans]MBU2725658.1 hypothetical protein [Acidithiobacillus ferridurans]
MMDRQDFLAASERACLAEKLQEAYRERGFAFAIEDDRHLVFEALHVLANGLPDRLFALVHPANGRDLHPEAHHGQTWQFFHAVADGNIRACASQLQAF